MAPRGGRKKSLELALGRKTPLGAVVARVCCQPQVHRFTGDEQRQLLEYTLNLVTALPNER